MSIQYSQIPAELIEEVRTLLETVQSKDRFFATLPYTEQVADDPEMVKQIEHHTVKTVGELIAKQIIGGGSYLVSIDEPKHKIGNPIFDPAYSKHNCVVTAQIWANYYWDAKIGQQIFHEIDLDSPAVTAFEFKIGEDEDSYFYTIASLDGKLFARYEDEDIWWRIK